MEEEEDGLELLGFGEADLESFNGLEVAIAGQRLEKMKQKIYKCLGIIV